MSQTMNQMLALIDRVIKGEEPKATATQALRAEVLYVAGPSQTILLEHAERDAALYLAFEADMLEAERDQRAREWLASLPAAQA